VTGKRAGITVLVAIPVALLVVWVSNHTYWEDFRMPMPPKGEALVNPFYVVQRFASALGAKTAWDRMLVVPDTDAVIVVSTWHWGLSGTRRAALERWVESGGRLVVDVNLIDSGGEFRKWSGISRQKGGNFRKDSAEEQPCRSVREEFDGRPSGTADRAELYLCNHGFEGQTMNLSWLESATTPRWALRDKNRLQAIRVSIGRGSVTAINNAPFVDRALFDGDHARVFVAAAGLRRGDEVHFLTEDDSPSLLALTWRHGAPVVAVAMTLLAALLWRGAVRFGPLAPPAIAARRSLADQIRGTGRFALRYGSDQALHAACVRALDEAAQRRIRSYAALTADERLAALARVTGFDRDSLAAAVHHPGWRTASELRRTLSFLEAARRNTLVTSTKIQYGTQ
jgi:hypothetical protein